VDERRSAPPLVLQQQFAHREFFSRTVLRARLAAAELSTPLMCARFSGASFADNQQVARQLFTQAGLHR